jgi:metal-sulfur cluster biosynthetic enzyme
MHMVTSKQIYKQLKTVLDPELHINIVDLGLIYDVSISTVQELKGNKQKIHIVMTLTTPGCPLASVFDRMVRDALIDVPGIDAYHDITIELTFDPPWIIDMMDAEARARLGL